MAEMVKNSGLGMLPSRERINRYIASTNIDPTSLTRYDMGVREARDIYESEKDDPFDLLVLAFRFGMAKGYRAAKAEARR